MGPETLAATPLPLILLGNCIPADPAAVWLHFASDALIALGYAALPFVLFKGFQKRKDLCSTGMLVAFATFILACCTLHVVAIVGIWKPLDFAEGFVKLATAVAFIFTVMALAKLVPAVVASPNQDQVQESKLALERLNQELAKRTAELADSHAALQSSNDANRQSEAEFRQLADSMPQIVWTATTDGTVDYYNERWYSFTGFERKLFGDQSWLPLLHPDDVLKRYQSWYASVRSGLPFKEEYRFYDRASATYRWHMDRALPIKNEAGTVVKWFGACTDIDDYKRAETNVLTLNSQLETRVAERTQELTRANEELRRTQTWLKAILQSATEVSIIALDNNGIITFFNSGTERLLGYRAEDVIGKCTPYMLYPQEQCELRARHLSAELGRTVNVNEIFLAVNQPSSSFILESVYLHRDGTPIDVSLAVSPMIDTNGDRLGKLTIAVDMRQRKALEKKLTENNLELQTQTHKAEEASRAKTDFLSSVSHEIRTPMNAILGMADLLWESELSESQRRYVEVFRRACTNLLSLVNHILDLAKIESGRFELEHIDFDLQDLLDITMEMVRPKVIAKKIQFKAEIARDTPSALVGDPVRLQQILGNLLSNAVKFTERGNITVSIRPSSADHNRLLFEISDTGIGIPDNKLETIFEDFTQAESSTTRRFGGTGLGLGICRRLVGRMGGELSVKSKLGEGSTFSFDALFNPSARKDPMRTELATSLNGCQVLIVDDNKDNRLIFAQMCRDWGMDIVECESEASVVALLESPGEKKHFDLVIVDRLISHSDGLQLVGTIRQTYPTLPALLITSDNLPGDQTMVLNMGSTEYAVKPVRRPELLRLICKLLGSTDSSLCNQSATDKASQVVRILVAEDSEDNTFLLQEYLKNGPYELKFAENGKIAVEMAAAQTYDLILMDVQMPVMDGLTAATLIRKEERSKGRSRTPLLALTANARQEDMESSRSAGCDGHISKPISRQELINAITRYARPAGSAAPAPERAPEAVGVDINVPEELAEAAMIYIQSRTREIDQFKTLVSEKNFDRIRSLAHNLKGTGSSYGFPDITRLGGLIETSAREQNELSLSDQLFELANYIQRADKVLKESSSGEPVHKS